MTSFRSPWNTLNAQNLIWRASDERTEAIRQLL